MPSGASSFLTLDTATNQLTLQATDVQATQSTQFTESLAVSLASHPSITETVTIEIDLVNPCLSTRVQSTHWPIELTHAFGDQATVLTLEDAIFPDTESENSSNGDGYSYCGALRLFSFVVTPSNPYLDTSQASLTELRLDVTDPLAVSQVYHDHLRVEIYMFGALVDTLQVPITSTVSGPCESTVYDLPADLTLPFQIEVEAGQVVTSAPLPLYDTVSLTTGSYLDGYTFCNAWRGFTNPQLSDPLVSYIH